jgi:glycosyltransferase involved in cell wall biosynthesis
VRGRHDRTGLGAVVGRLAADGWEPDVIHAHYWYVAVRIAKLARRSAIPLVISEHSSAFGRGLVTGRRRREARGAYGAAAIVCPVSESLRAAIRASGFDPPMRVVGNAVDGRTFRPRDGSPRDRPPTVVAVAGLTPLKGIDLLVRAVARTDARLVVVGDGAERASLEALAVDCGVTGRVDFRGELPKEAVARALAEADLFCLPSYGESQPVSVLEAMTCGVPVLATSVGGLPEIVGDGDGVLIPPGDLDALEGWLARMLADLEVYADVARGAR